MTLVEVNAIRVEVQGSSLFPFAFLWAVTSVHFGPTMALGFVGLVLACLLLHEAGHATVARACGIPVAAVGICSKGAYLRRQKSAGAVEIAVAAAGPFANLMLALLLWRTAPRVEMVEWIAIVNLVLGVSNLLPVQGSDGRRILAALHESVVSYRDSVVSHRATESLS